MKSTANNALKGSPLASVPPKNKITTFTILETPAEWVLPILLFLIIFTFYCATLSPAFLDDDSPETVTAAFSLGLQHPPSYAWWVLCQRLFCFLPIGNTCFRVNLASALIASLTVVLTYFFSIRLLDRLISSTPHRLPFLSAQTCAAVAALALGFTRTFWEKALGAKGLLYEGTVFFGFCILLCLEAHARKTETGRMDPRWTALAFFILGLGLCGHWQTLVPFAPVLIFFFIQPRDGKNQRLRQAFLVLSFFFIGLSPLLYLPLRAHLHPELNLGAPDQVGLFKKSLLREYVDEREKGLGPAILKALERKTDWKPVKHLGKIILDNQGKQIPIHFLEELKPLVIVLALAGLVFWWRIGERILLAALLFYLIFLLCALLSATWIIPGPLAPWFGDNYLLPVNGITLVFAAAGLYALAHFWTLNQRSLFFSFLGLIGVFLALPFPLVLANFDGINLSKQLLRYDYGVNLMKSLPRNSVFFAEADEDYFNFFYFQMVEKKRPDITMIPAFTLFETWGVSQVERFHPELGLDFRADSFPDHFSRIQAANKEIVGNNLNRVPLGYSYFDGAFHRQYLRMRPNSTAIPSGIVYLLDSPLSRRGPFTPLGTLRLRHLFDCPSDAHPCLGGIRAVYGLVFH
jgi:hypothetical protein